jgi:hypothetical protein
MKTALKFGLIYFLLVFAAGFLLAPLRELVLAPRIGQQSAELAEMPVMLLVIYLAAGWMARRPALAIRPRRLLAVGLIAFGIMLSAEMAVLVNIRGLGFQQYLEQREPVSGVVYLLMLLLFALMPWFRRADAGSNPASR